MPLPLCPVRCASLLAACAFLSTALPLSAEVKVEHTEQGWRLNRNGEPYEVHGIGGWKRLDLARELGANTLRTWGFDQLDAEIEGRPFLDHAKHHGFAVLAGIWVGHPRHGFNYADEKQVLAQREAIRAGVRAHKHHPAILAWGLGNEMEIQLSEEDAIPVWKELEELAKIVREEDPTRPISTVVAAGDPWKVRALIRHCPSIDILGVNAYGNAPIVARTLVESGWKKPFLLTEFGTLGHWEVPKTAWDAPIEPSSRDKAERYLETHRAVMDNAAKLCLGTFAFVWGYKQETTSTWYGMFLSSGEKLPSVDAMAYAWTGKWPANRSPAIGRIRSDVNQARVAPGTEYDVSAELSDPEGDQLTVEWKVVAESTDRRHGGDKEAAPPEIPGLVVAGEGGTARLTTPSIPGAYRLFLIVRDGQGGASADNIPFLVVE